MKKKPEKVSVTAYIKKPGDPPESFAKMQELCNKVVARFYKEKQDAEAEKRKRAPRTDQEKG